MLQGTNLKKPLPAAAIIPVGPFQLSTQPAGSEEHVVGSGVTRNADLFLFDELAPDAWGKCEMWLYDADVERVRDITSLELVLGVLDHDTDELLLESKRVSIPVTK